MGIKYLLIILFVCLLGFGCQQKSKTEIVVSDVSMKHASPDSDLAQPPPTAKQIATRDSIDKVNNAIVGSSGDQLTKAFVFLKDGDSTIHLTANIKNDHRIFGYSNPDTKTERLLLLSVFTSDVKDNPFGCELGAYYDTGGMEGMRIKYLGTIGDFVKALVLHGNKSTVVYFEKKWIELN